MTIVTPICRAAALVLAAAAALPAPAAAQQPPIKLGDIQIYSFFPAGAEPYRKGWQMALDEINQKGGVMGRKLEVISRDDAGKPDEATRQAEELVSNEKVAMIFGGFLSNEGLALADFAQRTKTFYLAAEPLTDAIIWQQGNKYTFRLRPSTYMQAMMLVDAVGANPPKRWATVAPNYEYGQSAVADFTALLKAKHPNVEIVAQQWPTLGKIEAGAVVDALAAAKPDAIFNVEFGPDLGRFVREGTLRGLFEKREVVSLLTGEPEYLDPLKDEAPAGWIVSGYPWYAIDMPAHKKFLAAYQERYKDYPRLGSLVGYMTMEAAAAILAKAGSTDADKLVAAARGLSFESPLGPITFRASDHQSTMGTFVGKLAVKDGKGIMVDSHYDDGKNFQPSDAFVKEHRPAAAQ